MPKPKPGESKKEYISRAVPMIIEEAKKKGKKMKPEQAAAIAASMYDEKSKNKETTAYVKLKEEVIDVTQLEQVEEVDDVYYFYGATTLPDRVAEALDEGQMIKGEILDLAVLEKMSEIINDKSKMGGKVGSHRTVGLFHDRVKSGRLDLDEPGFLIPGTAKVEPLKDEPGHYGLKVGVKLNKFYTPSEMYPDYNIDKIKYKIDNDVIGLSMEYNNTPEQEMMVSTDTGYYRYIKDFDDFRGFSFARANLIGNPTAVSIKEIRQIVERQHNGGKTKMAEQPNEIEVKLKESEAKVQELTAKVKELESNDADESKLKEVKEQLVKVKEEMTSQKLELDTTATKIKESIELAFSGLKLGNAPLSNDGKADVKLKEVDEAMQHGAKTKEWSQFIDVCETRIKEQQAHFDKMLKNNGIRMEETTLKVKCMGTKERRDGRMMIVPTAKTKDVIDTGSMNEATYYQTNAMFADKYVPGIVETFVKSDSLLTAMSKEAYIGGNDKYQWRIWTDFDTFTGDNTSAVDPDVTAVATTKRDFLKLETPIREYRQGVEITDFTQYHSRAAVGDLLMQEAVRAAEVVTNSLNADLFKEKCDGTSAWLGVNGLRAIANYADNLTMYGRTRTSYAKLYSSTSFDETAEAISISLIREGYAYVNSAGTNISDMAIVMHPHQWIRVLNSQDDTAATYNSTVQHPITMSAADPTFGFKRNVIPFIDGIPVILDEYCVDTEGNADTFAIIDMSSNGFVLITSKPIGMTGLAKVGTTEKVYVNWYGTAVYKRPNNIYLHDALTLLGA